MSGKTEESQTQAARIAVLGAGSWGGTLARSLTLSGKEVRLWSRDEKKIEQIKRTRKLDKPLAIEFPESMMLTSDLDECLDSCNIIILACTSQSMRSLALALKSKMKSAALAGGARGASGQEARPLLVSAAKGLESESFLRMSEVLQEILPEYPALSLSGPNLAFEILRGLPTASVIACKDEAKARLAQNLLNTPGLRLYSNADIIGVELGGSFKNVIAIAAGALDAMALGTNAKAALLTRGLAEMTRIAVTMGAKAQTMAGLAGLGDLMATCSSEHSRNYRLGRLIAEGRSPDEAIASLGAVAEGVRTAEAVCRLAEKVSVELPIASQVDAALKGKLSPQQAIMNLMKRPLVSE